MILDLVNFSISSIIFTNSRIFTLVNFCLVILVLICTKKFSKSRIYYLQGRTKVQISGGAIINGPQKYWGASNEFQKNWGAAAPRPPCLYGPVPD